MHATHENGTKQREAQAWQSALDQALAAHGGEAALAYYPHVANAFPSSAPNPYAPEFPLLDLHELKSWATHRGCHVRPAPERAHDNNRYKNPPLRFSRKPSNTSYSH